MSYVYDLVVIGGGPGGYIAAARAGSLGLKTALVEKNSKLGGTCLHHGCIPTKAWLHSADIFSESKNAAQFGIKIEKIKIDWNQIQKYKNKIININASGITQLMKLKNVDVFKGTGSFISSNIINVLTENNENIKITTKNTIISTGSKPKNLNFKLINNNRILNSNSIFKISKIPGSLTIIGGGIIGVEFASIFSRFGTKITILETLDRIIKSADIDCSKELENNLKKQNIDIHTNININNINCKNDNVKINFIKSNKLSTEINSELLLIAVGRSPLTNEIGLKKIQVKTEYDFIKVNKFFQSSNPNIYAIGDCINTPSLAHVASAEATCAIDYITKNNPKLINYNHIPSCIYTSPNVAWCGLTEDEALKQGYNVKIGKFNFARNGKAAIIGKRKGFIKFITEVKYGEILGVHIIGPQATEILAEPAFAMQIEATIHDISNSLHAHPTLYESICEAASVAIGHPVHG